MSEDGDRESRREPPSASGSDGCKLFVGNITYNTRDRELEEMFSKYGGVKEARVATDPSTGRSRGFAFVTMDDPASASAAVDALNNTPLDGRDIRVEVSTGERKPRGPRNDFRGGDRGGRDYGRGGDRDRGGRDRDRDRDYDRRDRDYDRRDRDRSRDRDRDRRDHGRDRGSDRRDDRGGRGDRDDRGGRGDRDRDRERRDRSRDR